MKIFEYVITDEVGIHARPAGALVKEAKKYASEIVVTCNNASADATKLMALMSLGIKKGMKVEVMVNGRDEDEAFDAMEKFFKENL
ncbi:MAG: HPr family phosphocarrier protein [Lachnospiraceae bacterium]